MDRRLVLTALVVLGVIGLADVVVLALLALNDKPVPDVLEQTITGCIVALAGILPGALARDRGK